MATGYVTGKYRQQEIDAQFDQNQIERAKIQAGLDVNQQNNALSPRGLTNPATGVNSENRMERIGALQNIFATNQEAARGANVAKGGFSSSSVNSASTESSLAPTSQPLGTNPIVWSPSNSSAVETPAQPSMYEKITGVPSMAGGGEIDGVPGDDQVAAEFSDGRPARLEDGEVVLPKEFVHQLGVKMIRQAVEKVTGKKMDPTVKEPLPGQGGQGVLAAANGMEAQIKWAPQPDPNWRTPMTPRVLNSAALGTRAEELARIQNVVDKQRVIDSAKIEDTQKLVNKVNNNKAARFVAEVQPAIPGGKPPPVNKMPVLFEEPKPWWVGRSTQIPIIPASTAMVPYSGKGTNMVPVAQVPKTTTVKAPGITQPNVVTIDPKATTNSYTRLQGVAARMKETGEDFEQAAKQIPVKGSTDVFGLQAMQDQPIVDPLTGAVRLVRGAATALKNGPVGQVVNKVPGSMTAEKWNARRPGNRDVSSVADKTEVSNVKESLNPQISPILPHTPQTEQQMLDQMAGEGRTISRAGNVFRMEDPSLLRGAQEPAQSQGREVVPGQVMHQEQPVDSRWENDYGWKVGPASASAMRAEASRYDHLPISGVTYSDTVEGLGLGQKTPPTADAKTVEELRSLYKGMGVKQGTGRKAQRLSAYPAELSAPTVTQEERAQNMQMQRELTAREKMLQERAAGLKNSDIIAAQKLEYQQERDAEKDAAAQQKAFQESIKRRRETTTPPLGLNPNVYASLAADFLKAGYADEDIDSWLYSLDGQDPELESALAAGKPIPDPKTGKLRAPLDVLMERMKLSLDAQNESN